MANQDPPDALISSLLLALDATRYRSASRNSEFTVGWRRFGVQFAY